jgi:hypothetical protein
MALLGGVLGACGFLEPVTEDPNLLPDATLDQLLVGVYVPAIDQLRGRLGFSVWMQQWDAQATLYNRNEFTGRSAYGSSYETLVNVRAAALPRAAEAGRRTYAGIFKVYEAVAMGRVASLFGDVAYSQAANPDLPQPVLDEQRDVYDAVQQLLDEAIADLESGVGVGPGDADLVYEGDLARWAAAAHTLKARFHLHWEEVDGQSRYQSALSEAQQGILDAGGDWLATFDTGRRGWHNEYYWWGEGDERVAGEYMVELLMARNDPRLPYYFSYGSGPFAGTYVGSPLGRPAGDPRQDASRLSCGVHGRDLCPGVGYATIDLDIPLLTCAENYLIIAEAQSASGDNPAARTALDEALTCVEDRWADYGATLDLSPAKAANDGLTDSALFDEIMEQKYLALFLKEELWNDYKRTCRPRLNTHEGRQIPGRLYYPQLARLANPNIPDVANQPLRNDNDPDPCPPVP